MYRILIADASVKDTQCIQAKFKDQLEIAFCTDGRDFHTMIYEFDPDILFLDLNLPHVDSLNLLRDMRLAGNMIPVAIATGHMDDSVSSALYRLSVCRAILKPWTADTLFRTIQELVEDMQNSIQLNIEDDLDYILLRLGFKAGFIRYEYIRCAVLERYKRGNVSLTKEIYPAVASIVAGGSGYVEKGIRDGIRYARLNGASDLWLSFFPALKSNKRPSNEEFLGRIAIALRKRERPRKTYFATDAANL